MTLADRDFFEQGTTQGPKPRFYPKKKKVATLAAQSGAPTLPYGCPLAWDSANSVWTRYTQPSDAAIYTITSVAADGTDGGFFNLIIDGLVVKIPFDATAAEVQTAVNAVLLDAGKSYTVACAATSGGDLGGNTVVTMTFSEGAGAPSVALDGTGLTDGGVVESSNYVLAASDAGTQISGTDKIRGFIGDEDGVETDATGEVQILVIQEGEMHRDDINTSAMRAVLGGSPSANELDAALRDVELRKLGLFIVGLSGVM